MNQIKVHQFLSTGLNPAFDTATTIEIENAPMGEGGFGLVFRSLSLNRQASPPLAVKLFRDSGNGLARKGIGTIQALQKRLTAADRERLKQGRPRLLDAYPALLGVPQFSFAGLLAGRPVAGYAAYNLCALGFEEFAGILEDDQKFKNYQTLPLEVRLRLGAQLAAAFEFLNHQALYIHADFKAEALFIDRKRSRCAIIDFDSGAVCCQAGDRPTTYGTFQAWLAPEIFQQLGKSGNLTRSVKVDLFSDAWSLAMALHFLLFFCHPLFFLKEISPRSTRAYLQAFQWPRVDPSFHYFRGGLEKICRHYLATLSRPELKEICTRFAATINQGCLNPSRRITAGQWRVLLSGLQKPRIHFFKADREVIRDSRPVQLSWDVSGAKKVELSGVGDVTGKTGAAVQIRQNTEFQLILTGTDGKTTSQKIKVKAADELPRIVSFTSGCTLLTSRTPVLLSWQVLGAERVQISPEVGPCPAQGTARVSPLQDTEYRLTASNWLGHSVQGAIRICISKTPPQIITFSLTPPVVRPGGEAILSWQVKGACLVRIEPGIGLAPETGLVKIKISKQTLLTLTAEMFPGIRSQSSVTARVLPPVQLKQEPVILQKNLATRLCRGAPA